jgi:hypothetical protein
MQPQSLRERETRLMYFLDDLLEPLGRRERRHWARVYVQGLLLDGERKSIEPMASRIPGAEVQALRQLVGPSPWTVEAVQRRLAHQVVDLLSAAAVWIIEETWFPKAGQHSVGVARQYCGTLGKIANCQVAVSQNWSRAAAPDTRAGMTQATALPRILVTILRRLQSDYFAIDEALFLRFTHSPRSTGMVCPLWLSRILTGNLR